MRERVEVGLELFQDSIAGIKQATQATGTKFEIADQAINLNHRIIVFDLEHQLGRLLPDHAGSVGEPYDRQSSRENIQFGIHAIGKSIDYSFVLVLSHIQRLAFVGFAKHVNLQISTRVPREG